MTKYIFLSFVVFLVAACSRYPSDVEWALKLAGENRKELEKVLEHYGKLPEDKLKLQSAYFLIANMPYHYTVRDPQIDSFRTYINNTEIGVNSWVNFRKVYDSIKEEADIELDILYITSEFLIRNIDFSFQVWQEAPWGKQVSFETFCEEILPYRLDHEPLEYWKEDYYAIFQPIINSMVHGFRLDEICMNVLRSFKDRNWTMISDFNPHGFGATALLQTRFGTCKEQAEFVTYALRSFGIPSGIYMVIQHPDHINRKHYWNYTHTVEGNLFGFDYAENVIVDGRWEHRKNGKVYRQCFSMQKETLPIRYKDRYIPESSTIYGCQK